MSEDLARFWGSGDKSDMASLRSLWSRVSLIPKQYERCHGRIRGRNLEVGDRARKA